MNSHKTPHPSVLQQAHAAQARGENRQALHLLEAALQHTPHNPELFRALAQTHQALGDPLASLAHQVAAEALETEGAQPAAAVPIYNVATGYFMKGEHATAESWYQRVLSLDPDMASAHQNLAVLYSEQGNTDKAQIHRQHAYRIQRLFFDGAENAPLRVIIPFIGAGLGNVPIETLLPIAHIRRIKYAIDYAQEEEDAHLPAFDVAFNAVGDPDSARHLHPRLLHFANTCQHPLLNHPQAVARTARHRVAELFADLADALIPPCLWLENTSFDEAIAQMHAAQMAYPVLLRPAGTHGGDGLQRCDSASELADALKARSGAHYLTAFHDFQSADGYYRKYRVIFIDKQPFAYHLAISRHWMVHYFSSEMVEHTWKLAEEQRFLQHTEQALGPRVMTTLRAMGQRLGLDYGGIDFACLDDGRLLLFETNATMLIHYERENGPLAYKNAFVRRIVNAFTERLERAVRQGR